MAARCQQALGPVQACLNPELVRCQTEERFKLSNEMKRGYPASSRDLPDRQRLLRFLGQKFSGPAEAAKSVGSDKHGISLTSPASACRRSPIRYHRG